MTLYFYLSIFFVTIFSYIFVEKKIINIHKDDVYKFLVIILCLIASFRWKVGGDWETYLITYERSSLDGINFNWSIVFEFINYIFSLLKTGVYGVNLFISSVFYIALYRLVKSLKFDLLLILVISVSLVYFNGIMGYVRQTLSLVFFILSLDQYYKNKKQFSFFFYTISIFTHVAAIVFLPIYLFTYFKNFKALLIVSVISITCIYLGFDILKIAYNEFILKGMFSSGALFRAIPLLICCIIYILFRKKLTSDFKEFKFVTDYLFFLSVIMVTLIFLSATFSAIADRLSFFMVIFQFLVIGLFFKKVININNTNYLNYVIFASICYFLITFSWFVFGNYSIYWLDYNFLF
tara:strand:+ start:2402 stop:3451 length:1050 start_codon:yes stop_codon:yes gene_type:complete